MIKFDNLHKSHEVMNPYEALDEYNINICVILTNEINKSAFHSSFLEIAMRKETQHPFNRIITK